jgi:1-acyl-sn-glycerol-3-phosphate acyltransferase
MMIISNVNRSVSFTMAASSYSKPVIGQIAKLLKVIPVHRPEDHKKKSTGKIAFESAKELKVKLKYI